MSTRIVGLLMLLIGGGFVFGGAGLLAQGLGGMVFIAGFLVFGLDVMRRALTKRN